MADQSPSPAPRPSTAPFAFDLGRLSLADKIVGMASIVLLVAVFLPWFGISFAGMSASGSGIDAHGYLFLVILTSLALIAYTVVKAGWETLPVAIGVPEETVVFAVAAFQLLLVLLAFLFAPDMTDREFGAYLGLLAGVVAFVPVAVPFVRTLKKP